MDKSEINGGKNSGVQVTEQFWEKYLSLLISKFSENNFF